MNYKAERADSQFVSRIKNLTELIDSNDTTRKSLMSLAKHYFTHVPAQLTHIDSLAEKIQRVPANRKLQEELTQKYNHLIVVYEKEKQERGQYLKRIIHIILGLAEAETFYETQNASARCLGTMLLLTGEKNSGYARQHQRLRPAYKAILALRLVDKVLADDALKHPYLLKHKGLLERFDNQEKMDEWTQFIATPVIAAALIQDIGLNHDSAQKILVGDDGSLDPFRDINEEERKQLLKINYQYTLTYLSDALFTGEDKGDQEVVNFATELMQNSFIGKSGIGDIIKIPQIYSSVVLSTKPSYNRQKLPQGYMLIEQLAKQKAVSRRLAGYFNAITGYFPPGFGICFIPLNDKGEEKTQYEYAIVTRLNPENPAEPVCRIVTRHQTFCTPVKEIRIPAERNLFFNASKQKLTKIDRDRMAEILSHLRKNFTMDDVDNHIPGYWEPHDYFAEKRNQNLWR